MQQTGCKTVLQKILNANRLIQNLQDLPWLVNAYPTNASIPFPKLRVAGFDSRFPLQFKLLRDLVVQVQRLGRTFVVRACQ